MGTVAESELRRRGGDVAQVRLRMLGPLAFERDGSTCKLPTSRKACGLLAYLALTGRAVPRARLCALLWDEAANDPRSELRWCLSKLRGVLSDADGRALIANDDTIALQMDGWFVDAVAVSKAVEHGLGSLDSDTLQFLSDLYRGEALEGLVIERCHEFNFWLTALRSRYSASRVELLRTLVDRMPAESAKGFAALETWAEIAPFDNDAQILLLKRLAERGRIDAGKRHIAAAERLYQAESLDFAPIRDGWRGLCAARAAAPAQSVSMRADESALSASPHRSSLAVFPLRTSPDTGGGSETARGLTHDIITRLAKLRSFFVIAEGSVFALRDQGVGPRKAGRRLRVEYVANGSVTRRS